MMRTITVEEFQNELKSKWDNKDDYTFVCPRCKTKQTAKDLIAAGVGENFAEVWGKLGYSCIGRFQDDKGCDWSLGGLFKIHELEVIDEEGVAHPMFEIADNKGEGNE